MILNFKNGLDLNDLEFKKLTWEKNWEFSVLTDFVILIYSYNGLFFSILRGFYLTSKMAAGWENRLSSQQF